MGIIPADAYVMKLEMGSKESETIQTWLAEGKGQNPIGVHGTSVEELTKIAGNGYLHGADSKYYAGINPFYAELQQAGYTHIYFLYPLIKVLSQEWIGSIESSGFLPEGGDIHVLDPIQIRSAEKYAMVAAISDRFKSHLKNNGFDDELIANARDVDVMWLALSFNLLAIDTYQPADWELDANRAARISSWYGNQDMDDWLDSRSQSVVSQALTRIESSVLIEIIKDSLAAPGVLLYFNEDMIGDMQGRTLSLGVEMDTDLVIGSKGALPSSVISGAVLVF